MSIRAGMVGDQHHPPRGQALETVVAHVNKPGERAPAMEERQMPVDQPLEEALGPLRRRQPAGQQANEGQLQPDRRQRAKGQIVGQEVVDGADATCGESLRAALGSGRRFGVQGEEVEPEQRVLANQCFQLGENGLKMAARADWFSLASAAGIGREHRRGKEPQLVPPARARPCRTPPGGRTGRPGGRW